MAEEDDDDDPHEEAEPIAFPSLGLLDLARITGSSHAPAPSASLVTACKGALAIGFGKHILACYTGDVLNAVRNNNNVSGSFRLAQPIDSQGGHVQCLCAGKANGGDAVFAAIDGQGSARLTCLDFPSLLAGKLDELFWYQPKIQPLRVQASPKEGNKILCTSGNGAEIVDADSVMQHGVEGPFAKLENASCASWSPTDSARVCWCDGDSGTLHVGSLGQNGEVTVETSIDVLSLGDGDGKLRDVEDVHWSDPDNVCLILRAEYEEGLEDLPAAALNLPNGTLTVFKGTGTVRCEEGTVPGPSKGPRGAFVWLGEWRAAIVSDRLLEDEHFVLVRPQGERPPAQLVNREDDRLALTLPMTEQEENDSICGLTVDRSVGKGLEIVHPDPSRGFLPPGPIVVLLTCAGYVSLVCATTTNPEALPELSLDERSAELTSCCPSRLAVSAQEEEHTWGETVDSDAQQGKGDDVSDSFSFGDEGEEEKEGGQEEEEGESGAEQEYSTLSDHEADDRKRVNLEKDPVVHLPRLGVEGAIARIEDDVEEKLTAVVKALSRLDGTVADVKQGNGHAPFTETQVNEAKKQASRLRREVSNMMKRNEDIRSRVDSAHSNVKTVANKQASIRGEIESSRAGDLVDSQLRSLRSETIERFREVRERMEELQQWLDERTKDEPHPGSQSVRARKDHAMQLCRLIQRFDNWATSLSDKLAATERRAQNLSLVPSSFPQRIHPSSTGDGVSEGRLTLRSPRSDGAREQHALRKKTKRHSWLEAQERLRQQFPEEPTFTTVCEEPERGAAERESHEKCTPADVRVHFNLAVSSKDVASSRVWHTPSHEKKEGRERLPAFHTSSYGEKAVAQQVASFPGQPGGFASFGFHRYSTEQQGGTSWSFASVGIPSAPSTAAEQDGKRDAPEPTLQKHEEPGNSSSATTKPQEATKPPMPPLSTNLPTPPGADSSSFEKEGKPGESKPQEATKPPMPPLSTNLPTPPGADSGRSQKEEKPGESKPQEATKPPMPPLSTNLPTPPGADSGRSQKEGKPGEGKPGESKPQEATKPPMPPSSTNLPMPPGADSGRSQKEEKPGESKPQEATKPPMPPFSTNLPPPPGGNSSTQQTQDSNAQAKKGEIQFQADMDMGQAPGGVNFGSGLQSQSTSTPWMEQAQAQGERTEGIFSAATSSSSSTFSTTSSGFSQKPGFAVSSSWSSGTASPFATQQQAQETAYSSSPFTLASGSGSSSSAFSNQQPSSGGSGTGWQPFGESAPSLNTSSTFSTTSSGFPQRPGFAVSSSWSSGTASPFATQQQAQETAYSSSPFTLASGSGSSSSAFSNQQPSSGGSGTGWQPFGESAPSLNTFSATGQSFGQGQGQGHGFPNFAAGASMSSASGGATEGIPVFAPAFGQTQDGQQQAFGQGQPDLCSRRTEQTAPQGPAFAQFAWNANQGGQGGSPFAQMHQQGPFMQSFNPGGFGQPGAGFGSSSGSHHGFGGAFGSTGAPFGSNSADFSNMRR